MGEFLSTFKEICAGTIKKATLIAAFNYALCFTISCKVLQLVHFTGRWPETLEWSGVLNYLSLGYYPVLILCYWTVLKLSNSIPTMLLNFHELITAKKDRDNIYGAKFEKHEVRAAIRNLNIVTGKYLDVKIDRLALFQWIMELRALLTQETYTEIRKSCNETLENLKIRMATASRIFFTIVITFATNPFYSPVLFGLIVFSILLYILATYFLYRIMDQVPVILHKIIMESNLFIPM